MLRVAAWLAVALAILLCVDPPALFAKAASIAELAFIEPVLSSEASTLPETALAAHDILAAIPGAKRQADRPERATPAVCTRTRNEYREWLSGVKQARYSFSTAWRRMGSGCNSIGPVQTALEGAGGSGNCYAMGYDYALNDAVTNAFVMCRGRQLQQPVSD